MDLLKNLFNKKDEPIKSYEEFWDWFQKNRNMFFSVIKDKGDIQRFFFSKLSAKLKELKEGIFYLTGMFDKNTVELILTPDGAIKNIYFIEELVAAAPKLDGWRFTALKRASDIKDTSIGMAGYQFNSGNIKFYANERAIFPDEIDIVAAHDDFNAQNKAAITNGVHIFLDNFLGELNFATTVDNLTVISKNDAEKELIPVEKLKSYLTWRQAEFIEKYEGLRHNTENDSYAMLQAELENGNMLLAVINTDLLDWPGKASHPWILDIEIKYDGSKHNGMPDNTTSELLNAIENDIMKQLKDFDGYLNVGRQTAEGARNVFFACEDFRASSKVMDQMVRKYADRIEIDHRIYKDKYWQTFERFRNG